MDLTLIVIALGVVIITTIYLLIKRSLFATTRPIYTECKSSLCKTCNHCCYKSCIYGFTQPQKAALLQVLNETNATHIFDIILEYISNIDPGIIEMKPKDNADEFKVYTHSVIPSIYDENICSAWTKHLENNDTSSARYKIDREYKIAVMGQQGAGKSAITLRFVTGQFVDQYDVYIEDSYRKPMEFKGKIILHDILDTACRFEWENIIQRWIEEADIFLLCFAINDQSSYDLICTYLDKILQSKEEPVIIFVGTKCDLLYDDNYKEKDKLLDRDMIINEAKARNIPYIETSAKENKNIEFLFEHVVYQDWIQRQIHSHHRERAAVSF